MRKSSEGACYALSPIQQGMLLHQLTAPDSGFDIEQMVLTLHEELDPVAFRRGWERMLAHHALFRTSFEWEGRAQPEQIVHDKLNLPWEEFDWQSETQIDEYLAQDRRRGFRPDVAPLTRCALFRKSSHEWCFVWTFHHMLADGHVYPALIREAFAEYAVPDPPPYRDFIEWQQSHQRETAAAAEAYWHDLLAGFRVATPLPKSAADGPGFGECSARLATATQGIVSPSLVQAAWALVLSRNSGEDDVVIGVTRACRKGTIRDSENVVGLLINTLPVRVRISEDIAVRDWLQAVDSQRREVRPFEHTPLVEVQKWSDVPAGSPLFQSIVVFTPRLIGAAFRELGGRWLNRTIEFHERTNYPLTLFVYGEQELLIKLSYDRAHFSDATASRLVAQVATVLEGLISDPNRKVKDVPVLSEPERRLLLTDWNLTQREYPSDRCVHELIEEQPSRTPNAIAVVVREESLSYRELNHRANQLAHRLRKLGAGPESLIGVYTERTLEMMIGLLGIWKAGAAYVPLDPKYPRERLGWMLEDSRAPIILTQHSLLSSLPLHPCEIITLDNPELWDPQSPALPDGKSGAAPGNLAYVLFTSGSSGRPKGVMVEHRNVVNFFAGMDEALGFRTGGTWLAVTSISFDISILELFWTLSRGFKVVLQKEEDLLAAPAPAKKKMDFSLFYFAADAAQPDRDKYRLLIEGAKFADQHDFSAVWTPERHFHAFGGLYPNPALTGAAIAAITTKVKIRAGSVVLPLNNPIRVAEDWAVVDNLSGGRVGLSFASGWHKNDFALAPENWTNRKEVMYQGIETVRRLWRGESASCRNGDGEEIEVKIFPQPIQTQPDVWVAAAGSMDTFRAAGTIGANLLTNLLGQKVEQLAEKIAAYREARRAAGHPGDGQVTVMLHTFVGADTAQVRDIVREPFLDYLKTSTELVKQARWEFPAFARPGQHRGGHADNDLNADEIDALMDHAFDRYFETSGLFGSPEHCLTMVNRLKSVGVGEIACLVDFGVGTEQVLDSLNYLNQLRKLSNESADYSTPGQIRRHSVTHLQCTPSMAKMLASDAFSPEALRPLEALLLGGEALPPALAAQLTTLVQGDLLNMYGPTETTVWSTYSRVTKDSPITIGRPIANTQIYIVDRDLRPVPIGASGELLIGGAGVARGYLNQPEMTAERFVSDPFQENASRLYRTGDLARYQEDGNIEYLRRLDSQVKIRGHRIELGDVEAAIDEHAGVWESAVVTRQNPDGDARLIAYVVPRSSPKESADETVARWGSLWDETYRASHDQVPDATWNTQGWNSSYTGEPLSSEDMREWVDMTVDRIRALKPRRVLEIGCGTGLLLYRIAPLCEYYEALDISEAALDMIRCEASRRGLNNITLRRASADDLGDIQDGSFDLVVINSVIQYFPGVEYLVDVLTKAVALVRPGGSIFVGDVRNYEFLEAFHTSVELHRAPDSLGMEEFRRRVSARRDAESEMLVAPGFFAALQEALPQIGQVSIQRKRGRRNNEMTRFRYDAVLRVGERETSSSAPRHPAPPLSSIFTGIENPRLARELRALEYLRAEQGPATVGELKVKLASVAESGIHPEELWGLDVPYDVELTWSHSDGPGRFDATLRRRGLPRLIQTHEEHSAPAPSAASWQSFVNRQRIKPADDTLIRELREHVKAKRPEFMVPSAFVILDSIPRTPNGKVDWKALPAPHPPRNEAAAMPAPPRTELERIIAAAWGALLNVEYVGRNDNFFDLGANSLLMVQANSRLREQLGCPISLVDLFRYPTVSALAAHLSVSDTETVELQDSQKRGRTRLDAALRRMHAREVASAEKGA